MYVHSSRPQAHATELKQKENQRQRTKNRYIYTLMVNVIILEQITIHLAEFTTSIHAHTHVHTPLHVTMYIYMFLYI